MRDPLAREHSPRPLCRSWYRGGVDIIDFTDLSNVREVGWYTRAEADNWSAYWYEPTPRPERTW